MDCQDVRPGLFVRTNDRVDDPGSTRGFLIKAKYVAARRAGAIGQVVQYVAGHGGDVWFVRHEDGSVAVYGFPEMDKLEEVPSGDAKKDEGADQGEP